MGLTPVGISDFSLSHSHEMMNMYYTFLIALSVFFFTKFYYKMFNCLHCFVRQSMIQEVNLKKSTEMHWRYR